jgi:hypothetical protein
LSCCIHAALFILVSSVQRGGILNVVTQFKLFLAAGNCVATCLVWRCLPLTPSQSLWHSKDWFQKDLLRELFMSFVPQLARC